MTATYSHSAVQVAEALILRHGKVRYAAEELRVSYAEMEAMVYGYGMNSRTPEGRTGKARSLLKADAVLESARASGEATAEEKALAAEWLDSLIDAAQKEDWPGQVRGLQVALAQAETDLRVMIEKYEALVRLHYAGERGPHDRRRVG